MEINDKIPVLVVRINLSCCKQCFPNLKKILMKNEDIYKVHVDREKQRICVRSTLHPFFVLKQIAKSGKSAELIFYDKEPILVDRQHKNAESSVENQSHQPNQTAEEPKQYSRQNGDEEYTFAPYNDRREKKEEDANPGDEKHCEQNLTQNHAGNTFCPDPEVRQESEESRKCNSRCNCKRDQVHDAIRDDHLRSNSKENGREEHYRCRNYDIPHREKNLAYEKKVQENDCFHDDGFNNEGYDDRYGHHYSRENGREDHYRSRNYDIPPRKKDPAHEKKVPENDSFRDEEFNNEGYDDRYRRHLTGNGREDHYRCRNYDIPRRKKVPKDDDFRDDALDDEGFDDHYRHNVRGNGREYHYHYRNHDNPPRKKDSDSTNVKKTSKANNSYHDAFDDDEGSDDHFRHHSRENDHYPRRNYDHPRKRDSDHEKKIPKTNHHPAFEDYCRRRNDSWFKSLDETIFSNNNHIDHFDSRMPPPYEHYVSSLPPPPPLFEHRGFSGVPAHPPPPPPPPPPPSPTPPPPRHFSSFSDEDPNSCVIM